MKATRQQEQQILKALNQPVYEWFYRYNNDPNKTIYSTTATESNFKDAYKNTLIIRKELF